MSAELPDLLGRLGLHAVPGSGTRGQARTWKAESLYDAPGALQPAGGGGRAEGWGSGLRLTWFLALWVSDLQMWRVNCPALSFHILLGAS